MVLDTLKYVAPTDVMTVMTGLPKTELVNKVGPNYLYNLAETSNNLLLYEWLQQNIVLTGSGD